MAVSDPYRVERRYDLWRKYKNTNRLTRCMPRHDSCVFFPMNSVSTFCFSAFTALLVFGSLHASAVPSLRALPNQDSAVAGRAYHVEYAVEWEGGAGAFIVEPPVVDAAEGWSAASIVGSTARAADGTNILHYTLELKTEQPGAHEVPGLTVTYYPPPAEETEAVKEILYVEGFPVEVGKPFDSRLYPAIGAAILLSGVAAFMVLRRRARHAVPNPGAGMSDPVPAILHAARGHRLDGDYYAFYRELGRAVAALPLTQETKSMRNKLNATWEAVGYKAVIPTVDELDGDLRDVERAYNAWQDHQKAS